MILSVDPGIRGCGAALFTTVNDGLTGKLVACAYVKNPVKKGADVAAALAMARAVQVWAAEAFADQARDHTHVDQRFLDVTHLVVEVPQLYTLRHQKGDQNDLLPLAMVDGALAALYQVPVVQYLPAQWKGQMTKEATHDRVWTRLDASEVYVWTRGVNEAKSLAHNMTDAVAIGLFYVGRFSPKKVFPT